MGRGSIWPTGVVKILEATIKFARVALEHLCVGVYVGFGLDHRPVDDGYPKVRTTPFHIGNAIRPNVPLLMALKAA